MRWREKLAEVAGLPPLERMEGFWVDNPNLDGHYGRNYGAGQLSLKVIASAMRRWGDGIPQQNCLKEDAARIEEMCRAPSIKWNCLKPRPLLHLLNHSDCDGEIGWELAGALADDLASLVLLLPDEDGGGHIGNWREKTQTFIDGLRAAHAAKENVDFH